MASSRYSLNLETPERNYVKAEAEKLDLSATRWIAALVRRHAHGRPQFSRAGELAFQEVHSELRRIRTEINMLRRELPPDSAIAERIDRVAARIGDHMDTLRKAFRRNLRYWETNP
jgi:hypothetical protein